MSLRCSNCGASLVLPARPPPFVSCVYCQATVAVPQRLEQAVTIPPPTPARGGKAKYIVGAVLLVAGGALLGPLARALNAPSDAPQAPTPVATLAPAATEARRETVESPTAIAPPLPGSPGPHREAPPNVGAKQTPTPSVKGTASQPASNEVNVPTPPIARESVAPPTANDAPTAAPPHQPKTIPVSVA